MTRQQMTWRTAAGDPNIVAVVDGDQAVSFTLAPLVDPRVASLAKPEDVIIDGRGNEWWCTDVQVHTRASRIGHASVRAEQCPVLADYCSGDVFTRDPRRAVLARWREAGGTDAAMWSLLHELLDEHIGGTR